MKLKTLKDIGKLQMYDKNWIDESETREEAIKWVKEDLELVKNELPFGVAKQLVNRNIKRFDITSEDLK